MRWTTETSSPEQTRRLAQNLGALLSGGEVIGLSGDLGSGKTCFVQGLALGLGCDPEIPVTSPTFTIVNEYPGRIDLIHMDLYRLGSADELEFVGLRDLFDRGVVAVEWFDMLPDEFPDERLEIQFELADDEQQRRLTFIATGSVAVDQLKAVKQATELTLPGA